MRAALALAAALVVLPAAARARASDALPPLPRLGLAFDAGVPGGVGAALQLRLLDSVRLAAGPMWSGVGYGAKGGVVVTPLRWPVSPSLEVEAGYGFRADLSFLARQQDVPDEVKPVLAHASYWFASGLVGLDLGAPRGVSFFLRGGLAVLRVNAPRTASGSASGGGRFQIGDATLRATIPCAKLGLQFWF